MLKMTTPLSTSIMVSLLPTNLELVFCSSCTRNWTGSKEGGGGGRWIWEGEGGEVGIGGRQRGRWEGKEEGEGR